jgi:hydroxymethylbilane synthase
VAPVRIATRGSALARWQADHVAGLLRSARAGLEVELVVVDTLGDRALDRPIWELGGQGVFVKEVQAAVVDGRADLAVHSAKDLPSAPSLRTPGLVIAAVPERGDPRDVLVGAALGAIPPGGCRCCPAGR